MQTELIKVIKPSVKTLFQSDKHLVQCYVQVALYGLSSTLQKKICTYFIVQKRTYTSWHKLPASAPLLTAVSILSSSQPPVCWSLEAIVHWSHLQSKLHPCGLYLHNWALIFTRTPCFFCTRGMMLGFKEVVRCHVPWEVYKPQQKNKNKNHVFSVTFPPFSTLPVATPLLQFY